MAYTRAWDEARPQGNVIQANTLDSEIQYIRQDIRERLSDIFGLTALEFAADPFLAKSVVLKGSATSKIIPGATSLSLRNNADSADNLIIIDAGVATFRNTVNAPTFVGNLTGNASTASNVAANALTGNTLAAGVTASSLTSVGVLTSLAVTGGITGASFTGAVIGNSSTATALQTPRNINGVAFDGTANITVTAAAGTLTGAALAAGVTASSLTSVGTLGAVTVTGLADVGNIKVGSGVAITSILSGSRTYDIPSIAAGGFDSFTITVPGAAVGDLAVFDNQQVTTNLLILQAKVTSANTVTVYCYNWTAGAIDAPSTTYKILVFKF